MQRQLEALEAAKKEAEKKKAEQEEAARKKEEERRREEAERYAYASYAMLKYYEKEKKWPQWRPIDKATGKVNPEEGVGMRGQGIPAFFKEPGIYQLGDNEKEQVRVNQDGSLTVNISNFGRGLDFLAMQGYDIAVITFHQPPPSVYQVTQMLKEAEKRGMGIEINGWENYLASLPDKQQIELEKLMVQVNAKHEQSIKSDEYLKSQLNDTQKTELNNLLQKDFTMNQLAQELQPLVQELNEGGRQKEELKDNLKKKLKGDGKEEEDIKEENPYQALHDELKKIEQREEKLLSDIAMLESKIDAITKGLDSTNEQIKNTAAELREDTKDNRAGFIEKVIAERDDLKTRLSVCKDVIAEKKPKGMEADTAEDDQLKKLEALQTKLDKMLDAKDKNKKNSFEKLESKNKALDDKQVVQALEVQQRPQ